MDYVMQTTIKWQESGKKHTAWWHSESAYPAPTRVVVIDDNITADEAYRLACEGNALLWRGDFQNARQLLQAMGRRLTRKPKKVSENATLTEIFHLHRMAQGQRARILGQLLLPFNADHSLPLRRAPDVADACEEAYGVAKGPYVASLRGLLGVIGAHEWRNKGVEVPALKGRIHPHYGVFSPVRGEYVELVANTPLPNAAVAFDIGTGTGVLAAVLAKRGIKRVIGTDQDERALACAQENIDELGLNRQVKIQQADLFPVGKANLIVCNPPWVPAKPSSPLEYAVYDPASQMLRGFLNGLSAHLEEGGEGWLILSDLAEYLGLRTRADLLAMIENAGLAVLEKLDTQPVHPRVANKGDPLHKARAAEVTSLWRLGVLTAA
jgi:methylase of polypeptide subunit release factors